MTQEAPSFPPFNVMDNKARSTYINGRLTTLFPRAFFRSHLSCHPSLIPMPVTITVTHRPDGLLRTASFGALALFLWGKKKGDPFPIFLFFLIL